MIFILLFIAKAEWLLIIMNTHLPIHQNYVKTKLEVDLISVYYSAMIEQYPISAELFDHLVFTDADQLDIYEREVEASKHKLTCFDSTYNTTQIKMGLNNFQEIIKIKNNLSLVLDNTNLPCEGVVYDSIEPWITVMMQFSITKFYFYMKIFCIMFYIKNSDHCNSILIFHTVVRHYFDTISNQKIGKKNG